MLVTIRWTGISLQEGYFLSVGSGGGASRPADDDERATGQSRTPSAAWVLEPNWQGAYLIRNINFRDHPRLGRMYLSLMDPWITFARPSQRAHAAPVCAIWDSHHVAEDTVAISKSSSIVNAPPPKGGGFGVTDSSPVPSEARHKASGPRRASERASGSRAGSPLRSRFLPGCLLRHRTTSNNRRKKKVKFQMRFSTRFLLPISPAT